MPRASQRVYRPVRPLKLAVLQRNADEQHALVQAMLAPYQETRAQLLDSGSVGDVWAFWFWVAEETLLALCEPRLQ